MLLETAARLVRGLDSEQQVSVRVVPEPEWEHELEPGPEPELERPEQEPQLLPRLRLPFASTPGVVRVQAPVLHVRGPEREQVSALEMTAAPLRRAPACLVRRLLGAQRPSDDQTLRRHPDQHPRKRTWRRSSYYIICQAECIHQRL